MKPFYLGVPNGVTQRDVKIAEHSQGTSASWRPTGGERTVSGLGSSLETEVHPSHMS